MTAYYNEIDPFAAQWLRELIKSGLIADGEVDERSIEDVIPSELMGFTQCHFFAGIGGWSYALRLAGWPDDRPVWTGSCPCQPFSAAGKGGGTSDERHLWPSFEWLIRQCRPDIILGEQVESAIKHDWLDHVALSLEGIGYAVGAVAFPACSVGAPHIRQRLYWLATLADSKSERQRSGKSRKNNHSGVVVVGSEQRIYSCNGSPARRVADADLQSSIKRDYRGSSIKRNGKNSESNLQPWSSGNAGVLGDAETDGREVRQRIHGENDGKGLGERCATNGFWANAEWIPCRDGKARPVEPGTFPLAHGIPARVGRLRGYGNAIVAEQAAAFIRAVMDT